MGGAAAGRRARSGSSSTKVPISCSPADWLTALSTARAPHLGYEPPNLQFQSMEACTV